MKKLLFLLCIFLTSANSGSAFDPPILTQGEVLLAGGTIDPPQLPQQPIFLAGVQLIVGTVVGTEGVHKHPGAYAYGTVKIRVDEMISTNKLGLKVGEVKSDEIPIFNVAYNAKFFGVKIPPEVVVFERGGVGFVYKSPDPTEEEFRAAVVGKQLVFSLSAHSVVAGIPTTVWPLQSRDWISSCWAGPCNGISSPHITSGQDVLGCVAAVLSRQPNLSAVHAGPAGDVKFDFSGRKNRTERGLVWVYEQHGLLLLGAPLLDLKETSVFYTAPILDENGTALGGRNDDGNPLKAAIPVIADECHVPYAGDDAGRAK